MANTKSAAKSARQTARRRERNSSVITGLKTSAKKFRSAVASGDAASVPGQLSKTASSLDKAAKRGVIHRNAANRRKSRMARAAAKLQAPKA